MRMRSDAHDFVTPEEYLAAEARAEFRSEYYEGEVFAMVGAPRTHNVITLNIATQLSAQLRGKPCEAYTTDMRVSTAARDKYFYPDVTVVCGPVFQDEAQMTLTNPRVVIKILSPATEAFDRNRKFAAYAEIPSLTDYILVSQDQPWIEDFSREGDRWIYDAVSGLDQVLRVPSIECTLALSDVYDRIEFPQPRVETPAG